MSTEHFLHVIVITAVGAGAALRLCSVQENMSLDGGQDLYNSVQRVSKHADKNADRRFLN